MSKPLISTSVSLKGPLLTGDPEKLVRKRMGDAVFDISKEVEQQARATAPRRTGRYKKSIKKKVKRKKLYGTVTAGRGPGNQVVNLYKGKIEGISPNQPAGFVGYHVMRKAREGVNAGAILDKHVHALAGDLG